MTIITPHSASTASSSVASASAASGMPPRTQGGSRPDRPDERHEDPLREKRQELLGLQSRLHEVKRTIGQLHALQNDAEGQLSDPWRIGSSLNGVDDRSVASNLKGDQLLVPFGGAAFIRARVTRRSDKSSLDPSRTVLVDASSEFASQGSPSTTAPGKLEVPIKALLSQLKDQEENVESKMNVVRDEVVQLARQYFSHHLKETLGTENVDLNKDGQALNEEGLPFVDLNERLPEDDGTHGRGIVQPFRPEAKSKDERKAWMESVLSGLEEEEQGDDREMKDGNDPSSSNTDRSQAPTHKRVTSADRPMPVKSVLKQTPHTNPSTPSRFGASGMRKGFLNMNPSSPAAEHSSDPIEQLKLGDDTMSGSTSSLGSVAEQITSSQGDRMSRSTEVPPKTKKKTVRIQSPEAPRRRPSAHEQLVEPLRQAKALPRESEDADTEEEARRIVELLGIDAIKGHAQYESLKESMRLQEQANEQQEAALQTAPKRKLHKGPAVRKDIIERSPATVAEQRSPSSSKPQSAFRRGFLNVKPKQPALPPVPSAPRQSLGISALERATNNDDSLSDERVRQGLTPSVPHARPSKAYAEKLEARKRGEQGAGSTDREGEEEPAQMSKVRFGEDATGSVDVKVGTAATERTLANQPAEEEGIVDEDGERSSDDEELEAMGLDVYDEELDEDQVEALGYFSDEDDDPDIGFDSDDLVDAVPRFDSDAGDIDNDELRREYERIKTSLAQHDAFNARALSSQNDNNDEDDMDDEDALRDGQDLSMADESAADSDANMSRFRRERLHRALLGRRAVSRELGTNARSSDANPLQHAHNVGPSMLIPSLAKVRFPKAKEDGSIPTSAHEIELNGDSDVEEDRLEDVMRARLEQRDMDLNSPQSGEASSTNANKPERQPPVIASTKDADASAAAAPSAEVPAKPVKKPSLFKARMQGRAAED